MCEESRPDFSALWYFSDSSPSGLRWKCNLIKSNGHTMYLKDMVAGTIQRRKGRPNETYWQVRYKGKGYKVHRIIYALCVAPFEDGELIDHIDGNGLNNTLGNLRAVHPTLNARNARTAGTGDLGVHGVSVQYSQPKHQGTKYYRANWTALDGKVKGKLFSCEKFGDEEALRLAKEYRIKMIEQLNAKGAGYTERHGKEN